MKHPEAAVVPSAKNPQRALKVKTNLKAGVTLAPPPLEISKGWESNWLK